MGSTDDFGGITSMLADLAARYPREDDDRGPALLVLGGDGGREGERIVDLDAPLLGHTTREIRDLLKRADPFGLHLKDAQRAVHLDRNQCLALLAAVVDSGYLTAPEDLEEQRYCHDCRTDGCEYHDWRTWTLTPAGRSLAHASGRKPSTRKKADALVAKVLKAAEEVNRDPDATLWWVKSIRAAGPYADSNVTSLLHVDLAVDLRPRLADPAEQRKAERRLRDEARDRGQRLRGWDMTGYGHHLTRLRLAGHSKLVRLFRPADHLPGEPLFAEERDLTVTIATTAPYRAPAEQPLTACSWCRRDVPAQRVAQRGTPLACSPIGLCEQCLALGCTDDLHFQGSGPVWPWGAVRDLRRTLPDEPRHADGCVLCGDQQALQQQWWPADPYEGSIDSGVEPLTLSLCTICSGLLELADRPDRPGWWCARHQAACLAGMHALLRRQAGAAEVPVAARARKLPRLTAVHHDLLALVVEHGALSSLDLARAPFSQPHQDCRWWEVRLAHLLGRRLITAVRAEGVGARELVRATGEQERDLAAQLQALHTPGPVWDGEQVVEPEPPAAWTELQVRAEAAAAELDLQALQRRTDHPMPEAPRAGRW
ncbi:hypothetical protein [Kitasatospora sp. NPDC088783]|uniref:hypothetical protein n=1 Tax=Kitasatospora sp. NPDC088783 TaxID=3364077 RepID=UPI00382D5C5F